MEDKTLKLAPGESFRDFLAKVLNKPEWAAPKYEPCDTLYRKLDLRCVKCKAEFNFKVLESAFQSWKAGEFIQRAFSNMPLDIRELMISGYCGPCFDSLFSDE